MQYYSGLQLGIAGRRTSHDQKLKGQDRTGQEKGQDGTGQRTRQWTEHRPGHEIMGYQETKCPPFVYLKKYSANNIVRAGVGPA